MNKYILAIVLCVLLSCTVTGDGTNGRYIIGLKKALAKEDIRDLLRDAKVNFKIIKIHDKLKFVVIESDEDLQSLKEKLIKYDLIDYVEPDYKLKAFYVPNDPLIDRQWNLFSINVTKAWDIEKGDRSIVVAVVDTGIDYRHPDLVDNYVEGGYDFVNDDDDPMDDNGHGTHCAGIIAAVTDNGVGVAGIAQVGIMAEKVLDEKGEGYASHVAMGIAHAVDSGAKIISLSLGNPLPIKTLKRACNYAWRNGCLIVSATGNEGFWKISYPAAYLTVIAVGAIDEEDRRAKFSNYGWGIELVAPGVRIISTYPGGYAYMYGTSMACPHVAGVAALIWSYNTSLTNKQVRYILDKTAVDLGKDGWDIIYGFGKVNTYEALKFAMNMTGV